MPDETTTDTAEQQYDPHHGESTEHTPARDEDELTQLEPAALAKMVRELRRENASSRTNAKQQAADEAAEKARAEMAQQIGKALGFVSDDEQQQADPDKLTEQISAKDAELRQLRTERAAERAARTHDADVDALLDSRTFADKLSDLDPAADGFDEQLDKLVADTVTANPKFKTTAGQAPTRSSGQQHTGGTGGQATPKTLTDAVAARYGRA